MNNRSKLRIFTIITSVLLIAIFGQITNAMTRSCARVDANSPYWLAVRQQYDTSYVPPTAQTTSSQTVDANAPAWLAVRQQYEIGFVPSIDPTFKPIVDANSPEWLAVRQQYETTYLPPQAASAEVESQECLG